MGASCVHGIPDETSQRNRDMTDKGQRAADSSDSKDAAEESTPKGIDWADPSVPVGNAPAMPRWPMVIAPMAWGGWLLFLAAMAWSRVNPS